MKREKISRRHYFVSDVQKYPAGEHPREHK